LYARLLRLRHIHPSGVLCFLFLEGTIAVAVLLTLAELVSWWGILVLPACVAVMVKVNDVIAGSTPAAPASRRGTPVRQRSHAERIADQDTVGREESGFRPPPPYPSVPRFAAADPAAGYPPTALFPAPSEDDDTATAPAGGRDRWDADDHDRTLDRSDFATQVFARPVGGYAAPRQAIPDDPLVATDAWDLPGSSVAASSAPRATTDAPWVASVDPSAGSDAPWTTARDPQAISDAPWGAAEDPRVVADRSWALSRDSHGASDAWDAPTDPRVVADPPWTGPDPLAAPDQSWTGRRDAQDAEDAEGAPGEPWAVPGDGPDTADGPWAASEVAQDTSDEPWLAAEGARDTGDEPWAATGGAQDTADGPWAVAGDAQPAPERRRWEGSHQPLAMSRDGLARPGDAPATSGDGLAVPGDGLVVVDDAAGPQQPSVAPRVDPWWSPELAPDVPVSPAGQAQPYIAGNIHPAARQRSDRGDQLDAREQWARQSGSRRYD
jgi:hypothetical protein